MTKSPAPRTDTVLVTDDNKDVVDALAALLNDSGYKVIATYSAREALDSLDLDSTVGVVISDVRMPELDGFDFLRVVKHRFPTIKVILVTGHEITDEDVVPSGATILKKPLEFRAAVAPAAADPRLAFSFTPRDRRRSAGARQR